MGGQSTYSSGDGHDIEKMDEKAPQGAVAETSEGTTVELQQTVTFLGRLRNFELWLDKKLKIEPMGIERLPEEARRPPNILNTMLIWISTLMSAELAAIGGVGPLLGVSVSDSVIIVIVGTLAGSLLPAMTAILSPHTGLRMIAVSRFAFGIMGSKVCAFLNIFVNVGYAVVGAVWSGQLLKAASGYTMDIAVGIVIVVVLAFIIAFLGFRVIHRYESIAWLPVFILLCVQWAQNVSIFPEDTTYTQVSGVTKTGVGLTYFAIIFGQSTAWCTITGDYCVHYPAETSKFKIVALTWMGLVLPSIFTTLLGVYVGGAIVADASIGEIYAKGGFGGVFVDTIHPHGLGKFMAVIYTLAMLPSLAMEFYSSALSLQVFGSHFIAVPRFIWVICVALVTLVLAVAGRDVFYNILQNLLPILGYWAICFGLIILIEHFLFRPRLGGYDLEGWTDPKRTPVGIAGTFTLLLCIGMSFLGMDQTWYIGPLAKLIGDYGGDVGDYIVVFLTIVVYITGRSIEVSMVGR